MKKILFFCMASLLVLSLAACTLPASETAENISSEFSDQEYDSDSSHIESYDDSAATDSADSTDPTDFMDSTDSTGSTDFTDSTGSMGSSSSTDSTDSTGENRELPEDGTYTSKEDVALYIHLYGCLPSNFITKKEAEALGWKGGSLEPYAPGMCIGGSRFGNYEGLLPEKEGRKYTECDIDTLGADKRGAKRIVFSNDGLIYYTEDHYESFEFLYGEE